jgi:hypothetical protein
VFIGGTSLTFDTVQKYARLKWLGAGWQVLNSTATLA